MIDYELILLEEGWRCAIRSRLSPATCAGSEVFGDENPCRALAGC